MGVRLGLIDAMENRKRHAITCAELEVMGIKNMQCLHLLLLACAIKLFEKKNGMHPWKFMVYA